MTIDFICGVLAELFDSPCNFSPMDEYMLQDEYCEHHCGKVADKDCWKRYFEKRWADRKTEPTISKMEQVDKPKTQMKTQNSNLTFEKDECAKEYEELGLKELKELIKADHKTENCSEIPNNCEDKTQTDCGDFANRLAYERGVKHAWEVAQKVFDSTLTFYEAEDVAKQIDKDINVRSKDEPQTE